MHIQLIMTDRTMLPAGIDVESHWIQTAAFDLTINEASA